MKQRVFHVRSLSARATTGRLVGPGFDAPCALGRSGISYRKREGDGATPAGRWRLEAVLVRADRVCGPKLSVVRGRIGRRDGWCDDPGDRNYNRFIRHPYPSSAEQLWRSDELYDLVGVLSHNRRPRVRGAGSAIFLHLANADVAPTAGCIALRRRDMLRLLLIGGQTMILSTDRASLHPHRR
jgi:L,D-peptidoglycan transpeptidase YkuD (ErfK/YbiS/YcfS/YnhG family)